MGVYVTDMGTFADVNEAYGELLRRGAAGAQRRSPCRRCPMGAAVEIDAIVALPT